MKRLNVEQQRFKNCELKKGLNIPKLVTRERLVHLQCLDEGAEG